MKECLDWLLKRAVTALRWVNTHCGTIAVVCVLCTAEMVWGYLIGIHDGYKRGYQAAGEPQIEYVTCYTEHTYIGNFDSEVFHENGCITLPYSDKRVYFDDRDVALALGYRPCQNCNP